MSIVARDGQQSGKFTKLLLKVVPWSPRSAVVLGRKRIASRVWSSVMTRTMFGLGGGVHDVMPNDDTNAPTKEERPDG